MRAVFLISIFLSAASLWGQELKKDRVYPEFAVGPSGLFVTIEEGLLVTVKSVQDGSPAAATDLQPGDVLVAAGGESLAVKDPRVVLGRAIGMAEAEDGALVLEAKRDKRTSKHTVALQPLGAYRVSWPLNCPKSRAIVENTAKFVSSSQREDGSYQFRPGVSVGNNLQGCLASLFLLSTGDDRYLASVRRHVRPLASLAEKRRNAGGHVNWQLGYQGVLLCEYYLRTGDKEVLPGLQELCNWCAENQAAGGWGHGAPVGPGYTQSGLMNHAGLPILITLILAQECGIDVDPEVYARAVKLMYRMAGHGCIAYGDHRSELWWSNTNGRNAMLACAFSLLQEIPRYKAASEHLALLVADSYFQPEFGHTGGGFNVMWRGMASAPVPERHTDHYRRQMKELAWYYDLCRQPGGGFSMPATPPDNGRYSGLDWGTGAVGLTYTAPLKTLRITGAPRTRFSAPKPVEPQFRWGTASDLVFFRTDPAAGFGEEKSDPREVYQLLLGDRKKEASVAFCTQHLRHYSPLVRSWAARRLAEIGSPDAVAALEDAVSHEDPRVRRAGFDGISGYDNWSRPFRRGMDSELVSSRFLPAVLRSLRAPDSSWWEIDGALFALGRAEPDDIRKQLPLLKKFAQHEDWYLREGAFWAIVGLHKTITGDEFNLLTTIYRDSRHVFERSSYDAGFRTILKNDRVALDRATKLAAIKQIGPTTHRPKVMLGYGTGGIHEAAHRTMMVLTHFDPEVYELMIDDFVTYLSSWEPYYQHSVWLISGSKWQPGILKVVEGLGEKGEPIVISLKAVVRGYSKFDPRLVGRNGKDLEQDIIDAVRAWEQKHGKAG